MDNKEVKEEVKKVSTTFNMEAPLKTKAKMYIAYMNQENLGSDKPNIDLGKLINEAVRLYLEDVQVG